jgi:hypothetical protein
LEKDTQRWIKNRQKKRYRDGKRVIDKEIKRWRKIILRREVRTEIKRKRFREIFPYGEKEGQRKRRRERPARP